MYIRNLENYLRKLKVKLSNINKLIDKIDLEIGKYVSIRLPKLVEVM